MPGVVMRESLVLYRDAPTSPRPLPDWAAAVGDVRAAGPRELPPGYPRGLRFAVPLVEMPTYLPHLHEQVLRAGATTGLPPGGTARTTCSISRRTSW